MEKVTLHMKTVRLNRGKVLKVCRISGVTFSLCPNRMFVKNLGRHFIPAYTLAKSLDYKYLVWLDINDSYSVWDAVPDKMSTKEYLKLIEYEEV